MTKNNYETGRLNLPFVGHCTFGKYPVCDIENVNADIAILGAPFDCGAQYRAGARFGPRSVREASTLFSFGHAGAYDMDDDVLYLADSTRIVDAGDADIIHTNTDMSHENIKYGIEKILEAGALPILIGGDHSVNIPSVRAFANHCNGEKIHIVQIDAHLDFVDERHGVRYGHGNPMRRAMELDYVGGMTQIGIRNVSSSNRSDYDDARKAGSRIISLREARRIGAQGVIDEIPSNVPVYITIDIDAFDPSIAPGTGTPSHGGFYYWEVLDILALLCKKNRIIGADLVEVAPAYDPSDVTSTLAAQLLLNLIARIIHNK